MKSIDSFIEANITLHISFPKVMCKFHNLFIINVRTKYSDTLTVWNLYNGIADIGMCCFIFIYVRLAISLIGPLLLFFFFFWNGQKCNIDHLLLAYNQLEIYTVIVNNCHFSLNLDLDSRISRAVSVMS